MRRWIVAVFVLILSGSAQAGPTGLRVAIYSGTGAASDKTLALYRAVAAAGHVPQAIVRADVLNGRLTSAHFDVLVLPSGEDGKRCCAGHYSDDGDALGSIGAQDAIRAFVGAGGGLVAIEAGAYFACKNGGTLDLYLANYNDVNNDVGKRALTIVDPAFGSGALEAWHSEGGGWFATSPTAVVVACNSAAQPVVVRDSYGAGRIVLTSMDLELRGDSELDWTLWDNWAMGSHANSQANWSLLGRMIGWSYGGDGSAPALAAMPNPPGARVAIVSTHTSDGGAWPGLLPAVGRCVEHAGQVPLSIRFDDIQAGRLTNAEFGVVLVPGGYAFGYKQGLSGHESKIRDFVSAGSGYYGVCAGGFYAVETLEWDGRAYPYPLELYAGRDIGPLSDIAPWPEYSLTPTHVSDPIAGGPYDVTQTYYGGGHFTIPSGEPYTSVCSYAYGGQYHGTNDVVRFMYGAGHVVLTGTHPESRAGSLEDWLFWDGYDAANQPLVNPDDPWRLTDALFPNWLALGAVTGVAGESPDEGPRRLRVPWPNPSREGVALSFRLPQAGHVTLTIHDLAGRRVATVLDRAMAAGDHRADWLRSGPRAGRAASGVYFAKLAVDGAAEARKFVLVGD